MANTPKALAAGELADGLATAELANAAKPPLAARGVANAPKPLVLLGVLAASGVEAAAPNMPTPLPTNELLFVSEAGG